jgi:hypothetical protein
MNNIELNDGVKIYIKQLEDELEMEEWTEDDIP